MPYRLPGSAPCSNGTVWQWHRRARESADYPNARGGNSRIAGPRDAIVVYWE